jgi:peptidoglycan/LPS O-acetylase OafA/YrhL
MINIPMASIPQHPSHPKYRPDIDGLRAIAVLSVVFFYAFPSWINGGFIGVDVFFVISGYLISTIIFENLDRGTFSFTDFYMRRIKRIFPALLLVLVASYAVGSFVLFNGELKQLAKHISAGASFYSNFILWNEAGYFDGSGETKPLLHLWSLGIEEQFYIVWPLLLWLAHKQKISLLLVTIIFAVVSFVLNIKGVDKDAVATFYSPVTRFWELLCGSILAWTHLYAGANSAAAKTKFDAWLVSVFYRKKPDPEGETLSNVYSFTGLTLLAVGFWHINKKFSFPGIWAIVPVLAAVLIISAGPRAWLNRAILSNKVVVWFGLISFPLYLWHWPILSYARISEGEVPTASVRIAAIIVSVVLAWLTFALVERRIRLEGKNKFKIISLVLLMCAVWTLSRVAYLSRDSVLGFSNLVTTNGWVECDKKQQDGEVCKLGNRASKKLIVAYGDSHVNHIVRQLVAQLGVDFSIDLVYSSSCFMGNKIRFEKMGDAQDCDRKVRYLESIKDSKPVAVITGQRWHGYGIESKQAVQKAIADRVDAFGIHPSKLIVLGSTADVNFECEISNFRPFGKAKICQQSETSKTINKDFIDATKAMAGLPGAFFVYPYNHLCPQNTCKFSVGRIANFVDEHHLSLDGGEEVVREIAEIVSR